MLDADTEPGQIVSYSELDTFRQCPLKHHLGYVRRFTKPVKEGGALARGTLWHSVLEEHYRVIKASRYNASGKRTPAQVKKLLAACWQAVEPLLYDMQTGAQTDTQVLIEWMYRGYVEYYAENPNWEILATEHSVRVALPDETGQPSRYVLKAKIDLLVRRRDLGTIWVVDHKSGADLPTEQDLRFDDQFGLYSWLMKAVNRPVQGALHSAARTTRNKGDWPDEDGETPKAQPLERRFRHTLITRTEVELKNIALDAYRVALAAYPPEGVQKSLYSSPDPRQCGWKCDYQDAHIMMRTGRPMDSAMLELGYRVDRTRH